MYLTKSDYLLYKQCPKALWLSKNKPSLFETSQEEKLEKGNEITKFGRMLFPGGVLVEFNRNLQEMIEQTKKLLSEGVPTIYEAAFEFDGALVICDVLHHDADGWKIYEIKSSTHLNERHYDDMTFQFYIVSQHLSIHSIYGVYLNNEYVRKGALELSRLFQIQDVTEQILTSLSFVPHAISSMKATLLNDEVPMRIGSYCNKYGKSDFPCAAKKHCWSHIPDYSVFNLSRIGKKAFELYEKGIVSLSDIPDNYKLSEPQRFQVDAYKHDFIKIEEDLIDGFLTNFTYPLYFLDFETFQQAIPQYDGVKPYQQLPFQYSLHIVSSQTDLVVHKEFLAKEGTDPRRSLAECLIKDIPKGVCSVAYNMSFEKMVLRNLSETFSDLAEHLMDIHDHLVDLMVPFQKKWYYKNEMKGSYSIKYVLPAVLPNDELLDYKKLNIQNGEMAMKAFEFLHLLPADEIQQIRSDLLAYCKLDTLAMVKIWEVLSSKKKER